MTMSGIDPPVNEAMAVKYEYSYERSARSGKRRPEAECTETIGFESMSLKSADQFSDGMTPASETGEVDQRATETKRSTEEVLKQRRKIDPERGIFPPLLTTLNGRGRPMFSFTKESTTDGRMTLRMVRNECREIMRCFRGDGRLRMELIGSDEEDSEDCGSPDGYELAQELRFGDGDTVAEAVEYGEVSG